MVQGGAQAEPRSLPCVEDTQWESGETESAGFTKQSAERSLLHRERTPAVARGLSAASAA